MSRCLSIIYLYNKASWQKLMLVVAVIPFVFLAVFLWNIKMSSVNVSWILPEQVFGGAFPVLILIASMVLALLTVANTLNGRKDLKATHATIGFTLRRMHTSPIGSYFAVLVYAFMVILIVWAVVILSFMLIGLTGLSMPETNQVKISLALGLLRTDFGHALIPIAHPLGLIFNLVAMTAMASECARSCYLTWHNGSPSIGFALISATMVYTWAMETENTFILLTIVLLTLYIVLSVGDVIFREKVPKGDPFKVNQYAGVMDMNSADFDEELYLEANSMVQPIVPERTEGYLEKYGRDDVAVSMHQFKKWNPFWLRRRFMPLGSNMEKANTLFGLCMLIGAGEHLLFFGRYQMQMKVIESSMKGVTIDSSLKMPYFWELQNHTYYGYFLAIVLILVVQMYWNYAYYNKETKSIYVLKRLPNRKEYPRTIWVSPVIEAVFIVLLMAAHTFIDFCVYMTTPDMALQADHFSQIFML